MPTPPNFRANPLTPDYLWNEKAGQYINKATGRFVSRQTIRVELDRVVDASGRAMVGLSRRLQAGRIDLAEWHAGMMQQVKTTHLAAAAMQRGGWQQMSQADFGRVGRIVRDQYVYLRDFADQIAAGAQPLDDTLLARSGVYGQGGRPTYYKFLNADMDKRGFDEIRSYLDPGAAHCNLCVSEAAKGFQPLKEMIPIGSRTCLAHDRCGVEYRNSRTGETMLA